MVYRPHWWLSMSCSTTGVLVGLRSFSCRPPKGIGWSKVTGLSDPCLLWSPVTSVLFAADVYKASGTAGKSCDVIEGVCLVSLAGV